MLVFFEFVFGKIFWLESGKCQDVWVGCKSEIFGLLFCKKIWKFVLNEVGKFLLKSLECIGIELYGEYWLKVFKVLDALEGLSNVHRIL